MEAGEVLVMGDGDTDMVVKAGQVGGQAENGNASAAIRGWPLERTGP